MPQALFLDTSPLGLLSQRTGRPETEACRAWLETCLTAGMKVYIPEIADYELRRELLRARKSAGVSRLNGLKSRLRYLPITTDAMLLAAELWATSRQRGIVTAHEQAIDGDVILAAQSLTLDLPATVERLVVTSNVSHISHFVRAELWTNIQPE